MATAATSIRAAPRAGSTTRHRATSAGYLFAAPFLLVFTAFMAVPIIASFAMSFTSFGLGDLAEPFSARFVGLTNYANLATDQTFVQAAVNTVLYTVFGVVATLALGLAAAIGVNRALGRLRGVFRVGYYLPVVTSIVA